MVGPGAGSRTLHDVHLLYPMSSINPIHTWHSTSCASTVHGVAIQRRLYVRMLACHWAVQCNIHCAKMTTYERPRTQVTCLLFSAAANGSKECIWFTINLHTTVHVKEPSRHPRCLCLARCKLGETPASRIIYCIHSQLSSCLGRCMQQRAPTMYS